MKSDLNYINCLIIDDEVEACDRLESILNKIENVKVIAKHTNSEIGISEVINLYPDIVFIDVEMPRKSGFDIIKEIKEQKVFPTFIFVTAYNQYVIKAIRNSAFDYLLKPVDIDELKESINRFKETMRAKHKYNLPKKLKSLYALTDREIEIIELLFERKSSSEIGEILFISKHTVDTHRRNILKKIDVKSTGELVSFLNNLH